MVQDAGPSGVLMVGSFPLDSVKDVFTKTSEAFPDRLHTIPDGEVGERYNYIGWQIPRFPRETLKDFLGGTAWPETGIPEYKAEDVQPTGYDDVAIASYAEFVELRKKGVIPSNVRFQVCLPTTFNVVHGHCKPDAYLPIEPAYNKRMGESIERICREIPHDDLVIQWDLCFEVIALEVDCGRYKDEMWKAPFSPVKEGVIDRLISLCEHIPSDVNVALHLCYGDLFHKHFVEPVDTTLITDLANDIIKRLGPTHTIEWLHLPVPRSRTDAAYFEPLNKLDLGQSRIYLGLVHANDEEGTKERVKTAQQVCNFPFGVATECGLGRTPKEDVDSILTIAKNVSNPRSE